MPDVTHVSAAVIIITIKLNMCNAHKNDLTIIRISLPINMWWSPISCIPVILGLVHAFVGPVGPCSLITVAQCYCCYGSVLVPRCSFGPCFSFGQCSSSRPRYWPMLQFWPLHGHIRYVQLQCPTCEHNNHSGPNLAHTRHRPPVAGCGCTNVLRTS